MKWVAAIAGGVVIAVIATFFAFARTLPYEQPIIDENGSKPAGFDGLDALLSKDLPGRVLWVHGMCHHDDEWVQYRAKTLAAALGATYQQIPSSLTGAAARTHDMAFAVPDKGRLEVTFFLWSHIIDHYRKELAYDADVGARRAPLNRELKLGLTNRCLVDAIIYSGRNGDAIRIAMRKAVCQILGGTTEDTGPCDLSNAPPPRRIAFVTESIGSKILFDALRDLWGSAKPDTAARKGVTRSELARRSAEVLMIYMVANQLPLLDQASPIAAPNLSAESSVKAVGEILAESRERLDRQGHEDLGLPSLTIVAFSDPNDLLSFRLPSSLSAPERTRLVNVTVSNDWTYFGLLERPLIAHCAYMQNPVVVEIISHGFNGKLPRLRAIEPQGSCTERLGF